MTEMQDNEVESLQHENKGLEKQMDGEITSLKRYFENQNFTTPLIISPSQETSEIKSLRSQLLREQKLVLQLEEEQRSCLKMN